MHQFVENEALNLALSDYGRRGDSIEGRSRIVDGLRASTLILPT